jgi:Cu/Ag efflux pump CusA
MATNRSHQVKQVPVRVVLPRTIEQRLKRMEDLLIEMRHEQDVVLKRLAKTQAQLSALVEKSQRAAPRELFQVETPNPQSSTAS